MQRTLVLGKNKQPLMPCHPARARALLKKGKAAVFRRFPFTIILLHRAGGETQPLEIKIDPGSKMSGIAVNLHGQDHIKTVWAANITHRGHQIKEALASRAAQRGARRSRNLRYRAPRFDNRTRPTGWLPPSLMSRVHNLNTWCLRLQRLSPLSHGTVETVRFDMQKMINPDIQGAEYQCGTLAGFELREYLLFRDRHTCQYCSGQSGDEILNLDHKHPRSRGGSNSVTNLVVSCRSCNEDKGSQLLSDWLAQNQTKKGALHLARVKGITQVMTDKSVRLRDAAAVNATRYKLVAVLKESGLPITVASGYQTKFNRTAQGYLKDHWIDAACIGDSGVQVSISTALQPLLISAKGHGSRQMCLSDKYGFPRTSAKKNSVVRGFKTGDIVSARVTKGVKIGSYLGRVAVRASGSFNITTQQGTVQGIGHQYCRLLHASDGFQYN